MFQWGYTTTMSSGGKALRGQSVGWLLAVIPNDKFCFILPEFVVSNTGFFQLLIWEHPKSFTGCLPKAAPKCAVCKTNLSVLFGAVLVELRALESVTWSCWRIVTGVYGDCRAYNLKRWDGGELKHRQNCLLGHRQSPCQQGNIIGYKTKPASILIRLVGLLTSSPQ